MLIDRCVRQGKQEILSVRARILAGQQPQPDVDGAR
jgi:hypothetical protein